MVAMTNSVITIKGLSKSYGKAKVLKNFDLSVEKGHICGLIGPNGAGKTTIMKCLAGIILPDSGEMEFFGSAEDIQKNRARMSFMIEQPVISVSMTARDNLEYIRILRGYPDEKRIDEILDIVGLADTGKKYAGKFSLGMKQRLGIAVALAGSPDFLILDEPTNGLDPEGIVEMRELILKLNRENGITVLISSHILDELSKLATNYGFMDRGKIVKEISVEELEQNVRKCMIADVSNVRVLAAVLDEMNVKYEMISEKRAKIFEKMSVTLLAEKLSQKGCELIGLTEADESLESFFIDLIGGAKNG